MPTSDSGLDVLVDTSVAVSLCVADHESHGIVTTALDRRRLGLAGHAAFETFSVLTRLPPPTRRPAAVVADLLQTNFPASRFLSVDGAADLLGQFASGEIAGDRAQSPAGDTRPPGSGHHRVLGVEVELVDGSHRSGGRRSAPSSRSPT